MRVITTFTIGLAVVLWLFAPCETKAERATADEMEQVCQNWLAYMVYQRGGWAGGAHPTIVDVQEIIQNDTILARSYSISPRGHVVVPILKELPPIKAYSEKYGLDVNETVGFPQLLREILAHRIRLYAKTYGSLDATQPSTGDVLLGRGHRREWSRFLSSRETFDADLRRGGFDPLAEVGPLLTTSWDQSDPYDNFCPLGDGGRCAVGCVATAAAQIMRYHAWPHYGVGSHTYWWDGDDSCNPTPVGACSLSADFSDAYDWAHMPDSCDGGCSAEEQDALAELCYEIGVGFEMDYGNCASGTQTYYALSVFPTYFRYDTSIVREDRNVHTAAEWFDLIQTEINAARPILYRISEGSGGHAIVCDGWRDTGGLDQYHMNYGWGGPHTEWFTLDSLYHSNPAYEYLIRNIFPAYSGPLCGTLGPGVFHIVDSISIKSGDSLRLMPGTTFNYDGTYPFIIYGALLAEGTASDSIVFASTLDIRRGNLIFAGPASSSSRFAFCRIESGFATSRGGGAYCLMSSPTFANCVFYNNLASVGGGISCHYNSSPTFTNCLITINRTTASGQGGGVHCDETCSPTFTNCIISGNRALPSGQGGGVYSYDSSPTFTHCTLSGNSAMVGGGVRCAGGSPVFNSTIIAYSDSAGIYFQNNASSTVEYCDIFGNSGGDIVFFNNDPSEGPLNIGTISTTNANGTPCDQYYNIFFDPFFVNPPTADLHLKDYSHCIGAADPTSPPPTDMDGNPRPNPPASNPDIGAYENARATAGLYGALSGTFGPGTYHVIDTIWVESSDTLHLMHGVTFIFDGSFPFDIYGRLWAEGTASDSVVFTAVLPTRWSHMVFSGSASSNSRLEFCVIENAFPEPDVRGGGVYCYAASPYFTDCTIRNNQADLGGGVHCLYDSSPQFWYCTISGNSADSEGGGVYCAESCSPQFWICTMTGNSAGDDGGGVRCCYSSPTFINCTISGNSAVAGGGVHSDNSSFTFWSCTISDNTANTGGGVYAISDSYLNFINCSISNNQAITGGQGGGVHCSSSELTFTLCTLSGNLAGSGGGIWSTASSVTFGSTIITFSEGEGIYFDDGPGSLLAVEYCDVFRNSGGAFQGDIPAGLGQMAETNANGDSCDVYMNIFLDPLFADTAVNDFHLTDYSHCIGAADPACPYALDIEGNLRPNPTGSNPDIGAYENWLAGPVGRLVISIESGNAVLSWPPFGVTYDYNIYGATEPFILGDSLDTVTDTTWTDVNTPSRPLPYFYYVTATE